MRAACKVTTILWWATDKKISLVAFAGELRGETRWETGKGGLQFPLSVTYALESTRVTVSKETKWLIVKYHPDRVRKSTQNRQ